MSLAVKVARAGGQGGVGPGRTVGGDPGLFSFLGKVGRGVIGGITGGVPGAIQGFTGPPRTQPGGQRAAIPRGDVSLRRFGPQVPPPRAPAGVALPGSRAARQRFLPGGETGVGIGCGKGFRPNKSSYFLIDGSFVAEGTRCVKIRRRNPMNPRALSRAIGRVDGGKRLQHRLAQIETAKFSKAGNRKHPHP